MNFFLLVLTILPLSCYSSTKVYHLSDDFIRSINEKQNLWKAGRNFPEDTPLEYLNRLSGNIDDPEDQNVPVKLHTVTSIPETFDAREHWPQCKSLNNIRNQEQCGSCWAFSAVESITDRLCIASNGAMNFEFSAEDVLTCCGTCGSCNGGSKLKAIDYWIVNGIVSGGDYSDQQGCQPYSDESRHGNSPACSKTCHNKNYATSYGADKHYGESRHRVGNEIEQIQAEILNNGPVVASFTVYQDFYSYKSGVYYHTTGDTTGSHAVKILGWGTENGTPYWLIANSWGADWADLGGFFKFRRGKNDCGLEESAIYGGVPML